ncbi:MAG: hypothetical protein JST52_05145 [Bacteroidetes bacterium]|nr:hypothetical protein [Bacteroidota bacterium]MBS1741065.1 hypothetical protein [Bacteroidota bacterium]MBS1777337.1 hypothetical protein [Bacteroidota bacterium]
MLRKLITIVAISCVFGCKHHPPLEKPSNTPHYFSIRQFANDQFRTYWGQPFSFEKTVIENGKMVDSSIVSAATLDWAKVLDPFFKTDISDPKYLEQYNFSEVDDDATVSKTYIYEAKDKSFFTRSVQITTDPFTGKIKSLFIETEKDGNQQKLYYKPLKVIQIQTYQSALLGKGKNIRTEYRFLY